ncbi:MAG: double-strand break repair protein AddB [Pseudomonadota bacterium]
MTLLFPGPAPRVFAVPPGEDYAALLAAGLGQRLADLPPEHALDIEILVNSRRAERVIADALAERRGGAPVLMPRLTLLGDLTERALLAGAPQAPLLPPLRRRLVLTTLVEAWIQRPGVTLPAAAAPDLAQGLAALVDLLDEAGLPLSALNDAAPALPELARHWEQSLDFLGIVRERWPEIREALMPGSLDGAAQQRAAALALIAAWQAAPPAHPIIVAGSTGSRPVTALLMAAIARLPQGALVLPGFDPGTPEDIWATAGADHPIGPFRGLLESLSIAPADVALWHPAPASARRSFLTAALRPAPVTDAWAAARDGLSALAGPAAEELTLLEAEDERGEAEALALAIRKALEQPKTRVAVVTRDATLARRLTAALARYKILPDDSLGMPLALSPAGRLAAQALDAVLPVVRAGAAANPVALAALLAHPFLRAGLPRADHRRMARRYERQVLRRRGGVGTGAGGQAMPQWPGRDHRGRPIEIGEAEQAWRSGIEDALAPLLEALQSRAPLAGLVAAHRETIARLSREPLEPEDAAPAASAGSRSSGAEEAAFPFAAAPDGAALTLLFDALAEAAEDQGSAPPAMAPAAYAALLDQLMRAETIRPDAGRPHPRVAIWGTMEARTAAAELTILAGLEEGVWPPVPDPGPWLSRPMRAALALPQPEREIGLSAHDFLQAACRPAVILARAKRRGGAPTVPCRWLVRLETLLRGTDPAALDAMRARGRQYLDLVPALDRPHAGDETTRAPRPCPSPPVTARPRVLSATALNRLTRDPYAYYAEAILGLERLDPIGAPLDPRDIGTALHRVMEDWVREGAAIEDPDAALTRLLALAHAVFARDLPDPAERRFRLGRLRRAGAKIVAGEARRQARGRPLLLEGRGRMNVPLSDGAPAVLTARADRIDATSSGGLVYDYKSGKPPSQPQIGRFEHQLHLQSLILEAGGFEGQLPRPAEGGAYIGVSDGDMVEPKDLAAKLPGYRAELIQHLEAYLVAGTGYLSRRAMARMEDAGDYDHLARRQEWEGEDG